MSATNDDVLHQKAFDFAQEIIKQMITLSGRNNHGDDHLL